MTKLVPVMLAAAAALAMSGCTKAADAAADHAKIADNDQGTRSAVAEGLCGQGPQQRSPANMPTMRCSADPGDRVASTDVDRRKALQALIRRSELQADLRRRRCAASPQPATWPSSRGHYAITTTDKTTSKPVTASGTYLTVYKKQADGSCKAVEDFIMPGPALDCGEIRLKRALMRT